jgi:hypothetical protein
MKRPMELPFVGQLEEKLKSAKDLMLRVSLRAGVGRRYAKQVTQVLSPEGLAQANQMLQWARTYLSHPHPELGRNGAVCPFVPKALNTGRFYLVMHEEVDGSDLTVLRDILLSHADSFRERFPELVPDDEFNSLLMVFPRIPPEAGKAVDVIHTELKSFLMKKGLMLAQFHPQSEKTAIRNPRFLAYRSPYPCIVLRHMGVHDIIFLGHNKAAFQEYARRFGPRFTRGEIGNEHGYVELYEAALKRHAAAH